MVLLRTILNNLVHWHVSHFRQVKNKGNGQLTAQVSFCCIGICLLRTRASNPSVSGHTGERRFYDEPIPANSSIWGANVIDYLRALIRFDPATGLVEMLDFPCQVLTPVALTSTKMGWSGWHWAMAIRVNLISGAVRYP